LLADQKDDLQLIRTRSSAPVPHENLQKPFAIDFLSIFQNFVIDLLKERNLYYLYPFAKYLACFGHEESSGCVCHPARADYGYLWVSSFGEQWLDHLISKI
jgi:hypothetical protein